MFRFLALGLFSCICLLVSKHAGAEAEFIQGSRIGLEAPPGFTQSDLFSGFGNLQNGASFLVVEMAAEAYDQLLTLPDATWAQRAIEIESKTPIQVVGGEAILLEGRQVAAGVEYKKWVMIARFDDFTALITSQVPMIAATAEFSASIDAAFGTVVARPTLTLSQKLDALPYDLGSTGNFRIVNVLAGTSVLFTRGPSDRITGAEQPMLVVSRSLGPVPAGLSKEAFSRHAVKNIASLSNIKIEKSANVQIADATWFQVEASGNVTETGEAVAIVQWLRLLPDGYLRVVGFGQAQSREADFSEYRKIASGIALKYQ